MKVYIYQFIYKNGATSLHAFSSFQPSIVNDFISTLNDFTCDITEDQFAALQEKYPNLSWPIYINKDELVNIGWFANLDIDSSTK